MKKKFSDYLNGVGITDLYFERASEVIGFYEKIFTSAKLLDIFVSEYIDADGKRQHESLWIFTKDAICEAQNFLKEDSYDAVPLGNRVVQWIIEKSDYDFIKADDKSRMTLQVKFMNELFGQMKASKNNCDDLKAVFIKYIARNFVS